MSASLDAQPKELDLAADVAQLAAHVELQNAMLAAAHERSLARDAVALPLGAVVPTTALPSSHASPLPELR